MSLTLTKRKHGEITVVDAAGRITFGDECNSLRQEIKEMLCGPRPVLVLNLKDVVYMDSGGIGALVGLYTSARAAGGDLKLTGANDKVLHVLKITRLLPVVGMFPDEASAIDACQKKASA